MATEQYIADDSQLIADSYENQVCKDRDKRSSSANTPNLTVVVQNKDRIQKGNLRSEAYEVSVLAHACTHGKVEVVIKYTH